MFHLSPVQKGPARKNLTNILKKSFQYRHPDKISDQIRMVLIWKINHLIYGEFHFQEKNCETIKIMQLYEFQEKMKY